MAESISEATRCFLSAGPSSSSLFFSALIAQELSRRNEELIKEDANDFLRITGQKNCLKYLAVAEGNQIQHKPTKIPIASLQIRDKIKSSNTMRYKPSIHLYYAVPRGSLLVLCSKSFPFFFIGPRHKNKFCSVFCIFEAFGLHFSAPFVFPFSLLFWFHLLWWWTNRL